MKHLGIAAVLLLVAAAVSAQQAKFIDVRARFVKSNEREMDERGADLIFDEGARRLRVKSGGHPLEIGYDDVQRVVVEVDTLGRKSSWGAKGTSLDGILSGGTHSGTVATSIDKPFDNDHFVYVEFKKPDGSSGSYGLVVDRKSVPQVLKAIQATFGERVQIPVFSEKAEEIDKDQFASYKGDVRYLNTDKQHPLPELRPDKALVVVVTPANLMMRIGPEKHRWITRLYANNVLVGITGPGTYLFFYLIPGEYFLASEAHDIAGQVVGMRMNLEAGKDYYLTQTLYAKDLRLRTFLSRHSKELVMYEVAGCWWNDWGLAEVNK